LSLNRLWSNVSANQENQSTDAFSVPRETTPAWESELLLSIGLVVAMLQLSPVLDNAFIWWSPRLSEQWLEPLTFTFLYAKAAVYGLIVTFVAHLTARGFWVALVGMRAVYPGGIHWDKLRQGEIGKALARERIPTLAQPIEAIDNFASLVFAVGFLIVGMTLQVLMLAVLIGLLGNAVASLFFDGKYVFVLTVIAFAALMLPISLCAMIDRRFGARLAPSSFIARSIRGVYRWSTPIFSPPWTTPSTLLLSSRIGPTKTAIVLSLLLWVLIFAAAFTLAKIRGKGDLDNYGYAMIEHGGNLVDPMHYADQRRHVEGLLMVPFIPSEYVKTPYLRLFVPYRPRHDTALMAQNCPGLDAKRKEGAAEASRQQAILKCAAQLYAPRLNGTALTGLRWLFASDPFSDQRGFVTMISVRNLAAGPHLLSVPQPQVTEQRDRDRPQRWWHRKPPPPAPDVEIPFWK
jgi:hypothetical protein